MTENALSADNQQGRLDRDLGNYIAGFVDGEGSFHIAFQRNPSVKLGIQIVPEFQVSQNIQSKSVLELLRDILGCGYIKPNHANNPSDQTVVFVVRSRSDLVHKVIPFFETYHLRTQKRTDFVKFTKVVALMSCDQHKTESGLKRIVSIAFSMNQNGKFRKNLFLKPSETIRQSLDKLQDKI